MRLSSCIIAFLLAAHGFAQDVQQQRREIIATILTGRQEKGAQRRWNCLNGKEPSSVREARGAGLNFTPDAADSCVAALQRMARDGKLTEIYTKFLSQTGGNPELSDNLARAIGASVLSGDGRVSIGNGKAMAASGSIAFDAGFVVAYTDRAPKKDADTQKMKIITESCLADDKDAGTCFSVGYIYGTQAFSAR